MTCKRHRKGVNEGLGRGRRGPPSLPSARPAGGGAAVGAGGGTVPYVTRGARAAGGDYVSGTSGRRRGGQGRCVPPLSRGIAEGGEAPV